MKIEELKAFRFSIPLTKELKLKDTCITSRDGFIIKITDDNAHSGWGEISPLPGFSRENLDDVRDNLKRLHAWVRNKLIFDDVSKFDGTFGSWLEPLPSVQFGFESAIIQILADAHNKMVGEMISDDCRASIPINALLTGQDVVHQARKLNSDGFNGFKLKVGRDSLENDIILTQQVRHAIGDSASLVVDANRAWDTEQAVAYWKGVSGCNLEYIEEPLHNVTGLIELANKYTLPIALDETLLNMSPNGIESMSWANAVILKPTLLGLEKTIRFARDAKNYDIRSVLSSSFETSIGLSMLVRLAAAFGDNDTYAGLDTLKWLSHDLSSRPLSIDNGCIEMSSTVNVIKSIMTDKLTEVNID